MYSYDIRVALYARVSTTDQDCGRQLRELREYVTARGWTSAGEFVDTGFSGAKANRPELIRLMQSARKRKFDAVAVLTLDRWGRSVVDCVTSIQELTALGVRFIAVSQGSTRTRAIRWRGSSRTYWPRWPRWSGN